MSTNTQWLGECASGAHLGVRTRGHEALPGLLEERHLLLSCDA